MNGNHNFPGEQVYALSIAFVTLTFLNPKSNLVKICLKVKDTLLHDFDLSHVGSNHSFRVCSVIVNL